MDRRFCQHDNLEMVFRPAGTSKKPPYRAYAAFWSCPSRNPAHTINSETPPPQPATQPVPVATYQGQPAWSNAPVPPKQEEKVDWDAIAEGKVRHGVVTAVIEHGGLDALRGQIPTIDKAVEYIVTGKDLEGFFQYQDVDPSDVPL